MRRQAALLVLAAALICLWARSTQACSCRFGGGKPCEEYSRVDVVFSGMVLGESKITRDHGSYKTTDLLVRLSGEEVFIGVAGTEVELITGLGGGDCGYDFKLGQRYLVYAHRNQTTKQLSTSICTRTRPLSEAAEDIAFFRTLPNAETTGTIFGEVVRRVYHKDDTTPFKPVADAEVEIAGEGQSYKLKTESDGSFRRSSVAPGKYKVNLRLPDGLVRDSNQDEGEIVTNEVAVVARGCVETGFYLQPDLRVSGRVVDEHGAAVARMEVMMRSAGMSKWNQNAFLRALSNTEGYFEFKLVPPGEYFLGIRILSGGEIDTPYPRTYYPGVPTRNEAKTITVEEGKRVGDLELRLPKSLPHYEVDGVVVWRDERPASGVSVYLSLMAEGDIVANQTLRTDAAGRFKLKLVSGLDYKVSAFAETSRVQSVWMDVPAQNGPKTIKLMLPAEK